jgi:hypothetical protein
MHWNFCVKIAQIFQVAPNGGFCYIPESFSYSFHNPQLPLQICHWSFPEFFRKNGVCVMTVRETFDFVTDPNITEDNIEEYLEKVSFQRDYP